MTAWSSRIPVPTIETMRSAFAEIVSARTWRTSAYLVLTLVTGSFWLAVTIAGVSGIGVIVPFVALAIGVWRWGAGLERRLLRSLLGVEIEPPYRPLPEGSFWVRFGARLGDPATWKDAAYLVLLFPLGLLWATVVVVVWSTAAALVTAPAWYWAPGDGGVWWQALLACAVGLLLALMAPPIVRALARAHSWIARSLLGASRKAEIKRRVLQLEATRARAVGSAEAERRRIERDLHDGAQARLVALAMELGRAKEKFDSDPGAAQALVEHAHEEAKATIAELRNLARGIHPAVLTDRGLDAALSSLAGRSSVPVRIDVRMDRRPSPEIESVAYFVVAEALTNVTKHASATEAEIVVARNADRLVVEVRDDGIGGAEMHANGGIGGLTDRVEAIDGTLRIWSPEGGPTVVRAELPCAS